MYADLSQSHLDRWDSQIRNLVGEWFGIKTFRLNSFRCHGEMEAFLSPSLRDSQNTLAIRTVLDMMTSPDDITRKRTKQFEIKQAENCNIERRERDPGSNHGLLNWHATYEQILFNQDVPIQSVSP
jgi:hypothetical protein